MKSYGNAKAGGAAARAAGKQKKILAVLATITLLAWSRSLLGGEDRPAAAAAPASGGTPAVAAHSGVAGAHPAAKSIASFEQAMERMHVWPLSLERRSLEGTIEDLTPAYWTVAQAAAAEKTDAAEPAEASAPAAAPTPTFEFGTAAPTELPLRLRSTALLGTHRYAVIDNRRYSEGEVVVVPGVGELLLEAVRSREALLRLGDRTWTLVISDPSTSRDD